MTAKQVDQIAMAIVKVLVPMQKDIEQLKEQLKDK